MMNIPIAFDEMYFQYGIKKSVYWNPETAPHMAVSGASGSGKTYLASLICAKISILNRNASLVVCDFKGTEMNFLDGNPNYYKYSECENGIKQVYERLLNRQSLKDQTTYPIFLYIDEFSSLTNFLPKKTSEELKQILANILMLGRSLNIFIILSQQRLDSSFFGTASRENICCVISLSNMSKEAKQMMFRDYDIQNNKKRGTGVMLVNGSDFYNIIVPTVSNTALMKRYIIKAVSRYS